MIKRIAQFKIILLINKLKNNSALLYVSMRERERGRERGRERERGERERCRIRERGEKNEKQREYRRGRVFSTKHVIKIQI